ncbi:class I SAM-dependent DNA methyltransferase [Pontivivens insulae]|uniref:Trans-aconitate 2-methyltransferase n=1 Tax=Pontivivens insulae TaxID=1639689 RepID=A0A2R8AB26_9RHOB|nr:methyltransferase domain-containing protein [Pontivivens insulae]RED11394.1 methyltransferase family protein [Pontivivens insulae]SPF29433.1 Trans-aconitate 2-methyltransferase [Pontivivens insulae]
MTRKFLDEVYDLADDAGGTEKLYTEWAASYDAEVAENGYVTPQRCAEALAQFVDDKSQPLIDIGCGTGLAGLAFRAAGFPTLDGVDLTPAMIAQAEARGIYRTLRLGQVDDAAPFEARRYALAAAVGLFSPSHAPAETIDAVMTALPAGGLFVFSLNDHALAERTYEGRVMSWLDSGAAQCLFREHGEHLPAQDIGSVVYVLAKN